VGGVKRRLGDPCSSKKLCELGSGMQGKKKDDLRVFFFFGFKIAGEKIGGGGGGKEEGVGKKNRKGVKRKNGPLKKDCRNFGGRQKAG